MDVLAPSAALGLAIGLWPVGSREPMLYAQLGTRGCEQLRAEANF
jgi:hypothetical protein